VDVEAFDAIHDEVRDVVVILFSQCYNPIVCLDIKDYDVCDFNPSDDHVSSNTIVYY